MRLGGVAEDEFADRIDVCGRDSNENKPSINEFLSVSVSIIRMYSIVFEVVMVK